MSRYRRPEEPAALKCPALCAQAVAVPRHSAVRLHRRALALRPASAITPAPAVVASSAAVVAGRQQAPFGALGPNLGSALRLQHGCGCCCYPPLPLHSWRGAPQSTPANHWPRCLMDLRRGFGPQRRHLPLGTSTLTAVSGVLTIRHLP